MNVGTFLAIGKAKADMTFGDITANRDFLFGGNTIMTLTTDGGRTGDIVTYLTAEEAEEYGITGLKAGWYDNYYVNNEWSWEDPIPEEKCFNKLPIPAGYGFVAQGSDGAIIELPAPLAE